MTLSSRRTIIGSIAVSIAFVMELTLVPLLLPAIQGQFDLSISELAWVFNSYVIAVALGGLLGGWLGDVFNTKSVFGAGVFFCVQVRRRSLCRKIPLRANFTDCFNAIILHDVREAVVRCTSRQSLHCGTKPTLG